MNDYDDKKMIIMIMNDNIYNILIMKILRGAFKKGFKFKEVIFKKRREGQEFENNDICYTTGSEYCRSL